MLWLAIMACLCMAAGPLAADDRDLLRNAAGNPYMYIVMDTSGSMHWTPACSEADACLDIDPWDGKCTAECTMGEAQCKRMCPDWGCVEYDFGLEPPKEIEVLMDNEDTEGVEVTGNWGIGGILPWIGDNYIHNGKTGLGDKSVRFTPDIPEAGTYHVYLYWSSNSSRASNVPVDVTHAGGTSTVTVNQRVGHGEYNLVGTFDFDAGKTNNVLIRTDGTNGYVAVDAIRFYALTKPDPPPVCLREGYRCQQDLCPDGDCYARLNGDDPSSKFFQAKQALYEVLDRAENVHFGFGSYEQDNGRLKAKHWLYRVMEYKPESEGFAPNTPQDLWWPTTGQTFPEVGANFVFGNGPPYNSDGRGDGWNCASDDNYPGKDGDPDGDAGHVGCFFDEPADYDNTWEMERLRRIPKLGIDGDVDTPTYYRRYGYTYRLTFEPVSGFEYGDDVMAVDIDGIWCPDSSCNSTVTGRIRVYYELVSDYAPWEGELARAPMKANGFFEWQRNVEAGNACNGLEPNDDSDANVDSSIGFSNDDTWWDYTFKWPTTQDPRGSTLVDINGDPLPRVDWFDVGDFVPFDWTATNKDMLLERMAPNTEGGAFYPDFRTAVYWQDDYLSTSDPDSPSNRRLRLKDEDQRPLLSTGATPIGASLDDFRRWFAGTDTESDADGWAGVAAQRDIDWACRQKYVLFLTDGNETCGGDPCDAARQLLKEGVKTFVVGFGLDDSSSNLGCIAREGGTEEPILPRNKDELVEALENILLQVQAEARSFASASIPAIQSSSADKIVLSSFIPLPGESFWPGSINVFRKPLPLKGGRPDTDRKCGPNRQSACHLFDLGEILAEKQAPNLAEVTLNPPYLRIGDALEQRRVLYSQENLTGRRPGDLVLFRTPYRGLDGTDVGDLTDLGNVLVDETTMAQFIDGTVNADLIEDRIVNVMVETLRQKDLGDAKEDGREVYVLGDVFHANPVVVGAPSDFDYFSRDLCGLLQSEDSASNCVDGEDRGYRQFANNNSWRRQMLATATNDGQLHFFDLGVRTVIGQREVYTDGSGLEMFSYIPRLTLPIVREQALGDRHIFSVDGEMSVHDVFIDPSHVTGGADPDDREWRTVLIGGLREAGSIYEEADPVPDFVSGYYALDITQPDILRQRSTDVDDAGNFNDPPDESLLPLDDNMLANTGNPLPSCLHLDYDESGHQLIQTAGDGADGVFPCRYPFPAELWNFTDSVENGQYFLDEEDNGDGTYGNGMRDLGDTWSKPIIGQIAVCGIQGGRCNPDIDGSDLTTKHVAIVGGGMDPDFKESPRQGYWVYMIDIETGHAIYKRELDGPMPADAAVIDADNDGIFDVVYAGTTAGTLYKIDLTARDSFGDLPYVGQVDVRDRLTVDIGVGSPILVDRVIDGGLWDPFPIFDTYGDAPIYFSPTSFFIPELGNYGLAFGTGDREDLWLPTAEEGRFYVFVDQNFTREDYLNGKDSTACNVKLPITEDCLETMAWNDDPPTIIVDDEEVVDNSIDFLTEERTNLATGQTLRRGWTMTFPPTHRATSSPFLVSGILVFSMFQPVAFIPDDPDLDPGTVVTSDDDGNVVCARTGTTRSFVVLVKNGNPVARLSGVDQGEDPNIDGEIIGDDPNGGTVPDSPEPTTGALKAQDRYHKIGEFTTAPFIDQVASKNTPSTDGATVNDLLETNVTQELEKAIRGTFPRGSRFNSAFQLSIAALRNSTGVNVFAKLPIAVYPTDWLEPNIVPVSESGTTTTPDPDPTP